MKWHTNRTTPPWMVYYINMENKTTTMTNKNNVGLNRATCRPTGADIQKEAARQARRQAAMDRRAERAAGIETETQQTRRLYANVGK